MHACMRALWFHAQYFTPTIMHIICSYCKCFFLILILKQINLCAISCTYILQTKSHNLYEAAFFEHYENASQIIQWFKMISIIANHRSDQFTGQPQWWRCCHWRYCHDGHNSQISHNADDTVFDCTSESAVDHSMSCCGRPQHVMLLIIDQKAWNMAFAFALQYSHWSGVQRDHDQVSVPKTHGLHHAAGCAEAQTKLRQSKQTVSSNRLKVWIWWPKMWLEAPLGSHSLFQSERRAWLVGRPRANQAAHQQSCTQRNGRTSFHGGATPLRWLTWHGHAPSQLYIYIKYIYNI